jgi:glucose/arabinose dehydrogenase
MRSLHDKLKLKTLVWAALFILLAVVALGKPGDRFQVSADSLPAPDPNLPTEVDPQFVEKPPRFVPAVPPGFTVSVFAAAPDIEHVRWLSVAPNGDVFLSEQGVGRITVMRDKNGDGRAETVKTFASGFESPHGMAFRDGALYVADVRGIWRLPYKDGDTSTKEKPKKFTVASDLRPKGWHTTREIAFDLKGSLYLAIGARADLEDNDPPPDATIQLVAPDGTMSTFASGLRNVAGLAVYPGTNDLWGTVNERDALGARLPPDYLARIGEGDFFGWPYAHTGQQPDPTFGRKRPDLVVKSKTPEVLFEAHSAPLGVVFYDHTQFPADYKGNAFVSLHGSGPFDNPTGYKVVRVRFENGKPTDGYEDFMTGFSDGGNFSATKKGVITINVWGTPAGLAVAKDGSLLIADDKGRTVWRVAYGRKN